MEDGLRLVLVLICQFSPIAVDITLLGRTKPSPPLSVSPTHSGRTGHLPSSHGPGRQVLRVGSLVALTVLPTPLFSQYRHYYGLASLMAASESSDNTESVGTDVIS